MLLYFVITGLISEKYILLLQGSKFTGIKPWTWRQNSYQ